MKKITVLALLVLSFSNPAPVVPIASGASQVVAIQPAPTPTPTPTPTITPSPTTTPTTTPQPMPTRTPRPDVFGIPLYGFTLSEIDSIRTSLATLQSCRPDVFEFVLQNTYGIRSAVMTDAGAHKVVNLSIVQFKHIEGHTIAHSLVHEARHNADRACDETCANEWYYIVSDCFR